MKNEFIKAASALKEALSQYCTIRNVEGRCQDFSGCEYCPANNLYNRVLGETGTKLLVQGIDWDAEEDGEVESPESLGLPTCLEISCEKLLEEGYDPQDEDTVANYLSDTFGYCVRAFCVSKEEAAG